MVSCLSSFSASTMLAGSGILWKITFNECGTSGRTFKWRMHFIRTSHLHSDDAVIKSTHPSSWRVTCWSLAGLSLSAYTPIGIRDLCCAHNHEHVRLQFIATLYRAMCVRIRNSDRLATVVKCHAHFEAKCVDALGQRSFGVRVGGSSAYKMSALAHPVPNAIIVELMRCTCY